MSGVVVASSGAPVSGAIRRFPWPIEAGKVTEAVSAFDLTGAQDGRQYVEVSLDKTSVTAGQTATLTITRRTQHPGRMSVVEGVSRIGEHSHVWPVAVFGR